MVALSLASGLRCSDAAIAPRADRIPGRTGPQSSPGRVARLSGMSDSLRRAIPDAAPGPDAGAYFLLRQGRAAESAAVSGRPAYHPESTTPLSARGDPMLFDRLVRLLLPRQDHFFTLLEGIAGKIEAAAAAFGGL